MSRQVHLSCCQCLATNRLPESRLAEDPACGRCKQPLMTGQPHEVDEAAFARIAANTDLPLVIDFWASWCGPCKMMAPVFEQAAVRLEPECLLLKVNTEESQSLAARYAIRSIPTLLIVHQGQEIARQAGAMDLSSLERWVRSHL